jgi:hypothetical protein
MVEKIVGKVKYYHDPELISYNNTGAVFYDISSSNRITGTINDYMTFFTVFILSGWGLMFFFFISIMADYARYTYLSDMAQSYMQMSCLSIFVGGIICLFIINKIFTKEFQTAMRGKTFGLMYPLTAGWRALHKKNGDMSAKVEGIQNKQVFTFFLKQYVCADIELEGDYKKQFDTIEWTSGDYFRLPAYIHTTKFIRKSFGLFLLILALFGDYGNTRKIRIYFKQPPQDGYMRIETF